MEEPRAGIRETPPCRWVQELCHGLQRRLIVNREPESARLGPESFKIEEDSPLENRDADSSPPRPFASSNGHRELSASRRPALARRSAGSRWHAPCSRPIVASRTVCSYEVKKGKQGASANEHRIRR